MDTKITTSNLKALLNKIFVNDYEEIELISIFKEIIDKDLIENMENNFILMIMISLLKQSNQASPLLKTFVQQLELELIFSCYMNSNSAQTNKLNHCEQEKDCSEIKQRFSSTLSAQEIEKAFWDKYKEKRFIPDENSSYKLPEEGKTIALRVRDNQVIPGTFYVMRFKVNHNGEVLDWVEKPYTISKPKDFEEVYTGILSQIMEYQKLDK